MEIHDLRLHIFLCHILPPPWCLSSHKIRDSTILYVSEVKYLDLLLNRRLTWGSYLKTNENYWTAAWLRPLLKFYMRISNKLLLYKTLLQPIWSYGIALWGTVKPSNTRTIQIFQAICLRKIANAPYYITNITLHNDLQIPTIRQRATTYYLRLHSKMEHHSNTLIVQLHSSALPDNPSQTLEMWMSQRSSQWK